MAPPLPLRLAIIGLSTRPGSWSAIAHLPGLLTSQGRSRYRITALLNNSLHSAQEAIEAFGLSSDTKKYDSPEALAQDPDVDVVLCSVNVVHHYNTIMPAIKAGRDIYVEWPIASNMPQTREIVDAAKASGSRIGVGLQRSWMPAVTKLREIVQGGEFGRITSSYATMYSNEQHDIQSLGTKYFTKSELGGNFVTIFGGHYLDVVFSVIGDIDPTSVKSKTQIEVPDIRLQDRDGKIVETVKSDVPDLITLHARLMPSARALPSATFSTIFRRARPFPDEPGFSWTITFEHGETLFTADDVQLYREPSQNLITVKTHRFDSQEVKTVEWDWEEYQKEVGLPARATQACLYAFAENRSEGDGWVGLDKAVELTKILDDVLYRES